MARVLRGSRFTTPWWIVSHLFVAAVAVAFVGLGFWQLDRLDQRKLLNERSTSRSELAPVEVVELLGRDPDDVEYRPVLVTGTFRPDFTVLVGNQTRNGVPGDWVLTPVELADGSLVAVSRGFVPREALADASAFAAPEGVVTISGLVFDSASGGRFATGAALDLPPELSRVDIGAWADRIGTELGEFYVQAFVSDDQAPLLQVPPPELGEGPHLSYAVQWFLFTTMGLVAYALVLHRVARGDTSRGDIAVPWDL